MSNTTIWQEDPRFREHMIALVVIDTLPGLEILWPYSKERHITPHVV